MPSQQINEQALKNFGVYQFGQIQGGRMKEGEEAVVAGGAQTVAAHEAGDASQVGTDGHGSQDDQQPEEGAGAGAGGA